MRGHSEYLLGATVWLTMERGEAHDRGRRNAMGILHLYGREAREMNVLEKRLLGCWVRAWREGEVRVECPDEAGAYRLRFALYGMRAGVRKVPGGMSQEVLEALEGVALRVEGKVLVAGRKDKDAIYDGLEGMELGDGEEMDKEAKESMERMRKLQESLENGGRKYDYRS